MWNTSAGKPVYIRSALSRVTMDISDKNKKVGVRGHNAVTGCAHCMIPSCKYHDLKVSSATTLLSCLHYIVVSFGLQVIFRAG